MGRIRFTPRSEPVIDWSEIESRLQEISAGARPTDLPVDPSVTLANGLATANDRTLINDPPVTSDLPVINRRSARGNAFAARRGRCFAITPSGHAEFLMGIAGSASMTLQPASEFNRVRADSN